MCAHSGLSFLGCVFPSRWTRLIWRLDDLAQSVLLLDRLSAGLHQWCQHEVPVARYRALLLL